MDILPVNRTDLHSLSEFLKRNLIYENITEGLTNEKIFDDPDFDPEKALKAIINSEVVGFMQGVVREFKSRKTGFIKLFATEKEWCRQGIASALLKIIEEKLWSKNIEEIRILDSSPNYLQPGLDPRYTEAYVFITRRGYKKFDEDVNMEVDLEGQDFSTHKEEEDLLGQGIEIKRASSEDRQLVFSFIDENFATSRKEVEVSFRNRPMSTHIGLKDGRVIAFATYDANNLNTGWFGPMGTLKECRGMGIGRILLKRCLQDMKLQGHKVSTIAWVGPIAFYYNSIGANVTRVFWRFKKTCLK
ncbi:MAG: GNAT family N-acetyltransferase [bacterium]|nr:GNAT family N-acetyltransferase [bacterium]